MKTLARRLRLCVFLALTAAFVVLPMLPDAVPFATAVRSVAYAQEPSNSTEKPTSDANGERSQNSGGAGKTDTKESDDAKSKTSPFALAMGILGGLALFLLGVEQMAQAFRSIAGDKIKDYLAKFTKNRFAAVATGAVATTVLDSSSVTIILLITLIHAGLISFANSLGVVLGANIGTAVGSQLIAFDLHVYAPIALFVGFLLHVAGRSDRQKQIGGVILGLGLLFFGLGYLGDAMEPLKENKAFTDWMAQLGKTPLLGALAGCVFTLVIQSSSATVGIAITMARANLIDLPAGIAIMLGAEIGTVSDTLLASIGRSREAVRTAIFHLLFNVATVALGLLFVTQLTQLAQALPGGSGPSRALANAHILFNTLGVALFIGFVPQIAALLEKLLPPKPSEETKGDGAGDSPTTNDGKEKVDENKEP